MPSLLCFAATLVAPLQRTETHLHLRINQLLALTGVMLIVAVAAREVSICDEQTLKRFPAPSQVP